MTEILPFANAAAFHVFAVFLRVSTASALLPAFGEHSIPMRIKLVLALAFTFIVAPAVSASGVPPSLGSLALFVLSETLTGLVLGIGIRLFVLALQTAGSMAAQSTSLSQVVGGASIEPIPAMGYVLVIAGLALAVMSGLHVKAAELLILSYEIIPMGRFTDASILSEWGVAQIGRAFALAFTLAAPFVILSVIYNLALGAINKAMPQLMVAFVGAPVITAGGLLMLCLAAPIMLSVWLGAMDAFLNNPFGPIP